MPAPRTSTDDPSAREAGARGRRSGRLRRSLLGLLAAVAASVLPVSPALGEGSVDLNTGPGTATRQALYQSGATGGNILTTPYTVLHVYAQAGETIQLGSSALGVPGAGNILVYQPGTVLEGRNLPEDPVFATDIFDCDTDDPGAGVIADGVAGRAQELAGPEASPDGDPDTWVACEYDVTVTGIYPVLLLPPNPDGANTVPGTVNAPVQGGGFNIPIWDITVRDAAGAVAPGRAFTRNFTLRTDASNSSGVEVFVYTDTGYEYQVNFFDQSGVNWSLFSDDQGLIDAQGDRLFASFLCDTDVPTNNECDDTRAGFASPDRRYPLFLNRPDPLVISGPGGLAETLGFASAPISPASNPIANASFTGSGGQTGGTNRGSGGTIAFTSPTQMAGLGYTVEIDTDRDGAFGNGSDFVDDTAELESDGTNAFTWSGRNGQSAVPACGNYDYRVRTTLSEVHFTMTDVETSGGTQIQRLSLPGDPELGDPLAASYNDIDPFKNVDVLPNTNPDVVTDGTSGPGFHAWGFFEGDVDFIDTWARLPEVQTAGTLRLLCADAQVVKTTTPSRAVPGEDLTFRLEVTNNGPDAAADVVVTDDLPDNVTFRSASAGCAEAAGIVTCSAASLAAGTSRTFEVVVAVPSDVDECIENTATMTTTTFDTNLANNESEICVPLAPRSELSIAKDPSRTEVGPGGQVMFTLVVRNDGPTDDPSVGVRDPLVAGLTLVSAQPSQGTCSTAGNTVDCDLGGLADGGSAQVLVTAVMTATTCVTNTAQVRGANDDPTPANNQDAVRICPIPVEPPPFDLVVSKTADDRDVFIGQPVTYRIVVRNTGSAPASNVRMTDTLSAPVSVVRVRASQGSCTRRIPMRCELGTIEAGARVTITIVAKHREAGCRQRNAASATGAGTDTDPADNMDVLSVCARSIKLQLRKLADRSVVRGGEMLGYRIRVRNPTPGEARDVRVCDRLPSGLRYVSSSPRARRSGSRRCWTIRVLRARSSRTFRVTVQAARGASGRKTNRVTASSPDLRRVLRAQRTVRLIPQGTPVTG